MTFRRVPRSTRNVLRHLEETLQSTKRFRLKKLIPGDDIFHFYIRFILPAAQGGTQRICRQDPATLEFLLKQNRGSAKESMWFWIGQVMHYGLYDLDVDSISSRGDSTGFDIRNIVRRCKRNLQTKIKDNQLTVPGKIQERERKLRALHAGTLLKEAQTGTERAAIEHGVEDEAVQQEVPDEPQHGDSEEDLDNRSTPVWNIPDQFEDEDNGDTSSVDEQFRQDEVQAEVTDETDTDDGSEENESTPDSEPDFREEGAFSNAEVEVLHDWRDHFCIQHHMTRAEFQTMIKGSHAYGYTRWTYDDFITKPQFLELFLKQLPKRKKSSMYNFRRHHDFNPPGEPELVNPRRTLASIQRRRPSRLSMIDGDDDEGNDAEEANVLNARESIEDADIWEIRATEPLSDNEFDDEGLRFDQHQEQHSSESTSRRSDENKGSLSHSTSTQSQRSNAPSKKGEAEESADPDVRMTNATSDDSESDDESSDEDETFSPEAISGDCTGNSRVCEGSVPEQEIDSISSEIQSASISAAQQGAQERLRTTHSHCINEFVGVFSIPSSPSHSNLLNKMPRRSSMDVPSQVSRTPTRSILRNESSPRRPRSPRPQLEEFMNTHQDLPVASLKSSIHTHPLQAIKRIAGNYGMLFTQLSQIEQEDELDDFVEYVSKYQKHSGAKTSKVSKNEETGAANYVAQMTPAKDTRTKRKRQLSLEDDSMGVVDNESARDLARLEIGSQEGQPPIEEKSRKAKRRKHVPADLDGGIYLSDDKPDTFVASVGTRRASSLQMPAFTRVRGIQRSASHPGTPPDPQASTPYDRRTALQPVRPESVLRRSPIPRAHGANTFPHGETPRYGSRIFDPTQQYVSPIHSITIPNTAPTPTPRSGYVSSQTTRSTREASFEFPTPSSATSDPILQHLVNSRNARSAVNVAKRPSLSTVSTVDRNKPYGSQQNPHVIPATPQSVRTVKLETKGEPREDPLPPTTSTRHKSDQKEPKTDKLKPSRHTAPRSITPGPVRSSSAFADPTPPSTYNHGIPRVSSLRLDQSFSQSPSFSEVMRQDDRVFRKSQPKPVNNPTRNPIVQAQIANTRLDDHNMGIFDIENNERPDDVRTRRPQNDAVSWQPQKRPSLFVQEQSGVDVQQQWSQGSSNGGGSQQNGQDTTSGNGSCYNLGIPGIWRNRMSG